MQNQINVDHLQVSTTESGRLKSSLKINIFVINFKLLADRPSFEMSILFSFALLFIQPQHNAFTNMMKILHFGHQ